MAKRVNPMAVKANVSYEAFEAARALGVSTATIRNWGKDGMEVMTSSKPYLILGSAIREYLQAKYAATRRPLKENELYCVACRNGCKPVDMIVAQTSVSPKTDLLRGTCEHCNRTATRMISHHQSHRFAKIFQISTGRNSKA